MEQINNISQKKALVIGELLADIISEENITSLAAPAAFKISQGGSAANFCCNLKWLGVKADLVATVGDDNLGVFLTDELQTAGLSDQYVSRAPKLQTTVVLVGKNTDTPDFIAYRSADAYITKIEEQLIEGADLLHATAFSLSLEPARQTILSAFAKANQLKKQVAIDWNFAPSIWGDDDGKAVFEQICHFNPLLKISVDDLERFTSKPLSIEEAKQWLNQLNIKLICLTCGKDGVWYKEPNGKWQYQPALPVDAVKGVTGAGDAFWSGFIAYYLQEQPLKNCIDYALEVARKKIEKPEPLYK